MSKNKAHLKTVKTVETRVENTEGETISVSTNSIQYLADSKESFYLMYSSMVVIMKSSPDVRMKLLAALIEKYSQGDTFGLPKSVKDEIALSTGCQPRSLERAITSLVQDNILVKVGYNAYRLNPRHIFKGSSFDRNKALKAVLELYCPNC